MTSTDSSLNTAGPSIGTMARIEALRLARHPVFVIANLISFGWVVLFAVQATDAEPPSDLMSWPVIPAFFVGLTSLVLMARQTRSTEAAAEAMHAAPGTEAQRTLALALACLVPFAHGLAFVVAEIAVAGITKPDPAEWWFGTLPNLEVLASLVALAPVACLGGGLLGVLVGRWLRFPGAAAVVVLVMVVVCMLGMYPSEETSHPVLRLFAPWATFHSGTNEEDGTQVLYGGSPYFYLGYVLCLCAAAVIAAMWHDRVARTRELRLTFVAVVVVGLAALGLAMTTGTTDNRRSDPVASFDGT